MCLQAHGCDVQLRSPITHSRAISIPASLAEAMARLRKGKRIQKNNWKVRFDNGHSSEKQALNWCEGCSPRNIYTPYRISLRNKNKRSHARETPSATQQKRGCLVAWPALRADKQLHEFRIFADPSQGTIYTTSLPRRFEQSARERGVRQHLAPEHSVRNLKRYSSLSLSVT
ncbi:uncharacterized [Tachysurus ichikawai]